MIKLKEKISHKQSSVYPFKEIDERDMTIVHYISTVTPDRYNEVMNPDGMDDSDFRKNPVVFFGHRNSGLPIAKNLWLKKDGFGVIAKTQFDSSDTAREVFRLNKEGYLNAWSVGFMYNGEPEYRDGLYYVSKWKLLEYSSVAIPANPDCLNLMLKEIKDAAVRNVLSGELRNTGDNVQNQSEDIGRDLIERINLLEEKNSEEIL